MYTKEELLELSKPEPELAAYLEANPFPGMPWHDLKLVREHSNKGAQRVEKLVADVPSDLKEFIQPITARDGHELQARVVKPASPPADGSPLILLIHGGGFIMGNNITQVPLARPLAQHFGATVVLLQYRLAPEYGFPQQQHDILDSVQWLATNAASLGADPSKGFIIGGSSAGGQLSAVTTQYLVDEGFTPKLTGMWQNITVVMAPEILPEKYKEHWISREDPNCENAIILGTKDLPHVDTVWKPDYRSRLYSPFNSPTPHKGMPPVFFQVAGGDPLRDDSFVYEDALKEAGVRTKFEVYPGVPHGFSNIFVHLKSSAKWRKDFYRGMSWLLGKELTQKQIDNLIS